MITWPSAPLIRPAPSGSTCAAPAEPSKNRSLLVPGLLAGRKNNPTDGDRSPGHRPREEDDNIAESVLMENAMSGIVGLC